MSTFNKSMMAGENFKATPLVINLLGVTKDFEDV